jgi:hypothetical protein
VWLRADAPEPVRRSWSTDYPGMGDVESCRALVRDCDYRLLGDFVLPEQAWWKHYYGPLQERLAQLAPRNDGNIAAAAVFHACGAEIDTYRKFSAYYGYVFLVMAAGGSKLPGGQ